MTTTRDSHPPFATTEEIVKLHGDPVWEAIWSVVKTWDINTPRYTGYCSGTGDHATEIFRAIRSASQAGGVPAGWKLVPVEPTQAMLDAANRSGFEGSEQHVRQDWSTMLSASPPPPATDGDALREALRGSMHALQALLNAVKTNPAMQGRQYIDLGIQVNTAIDKARNGLASSPPLAATDAAQSFQDQVAPWMMTCFGAEIAADRLERNDRFIEEALELVQASGYSAERAHQLVGYVFGRDQGDINQEVGGVMVTLAAHCLAHGVDMHAAAETELARVWTKVDAIRAKQASKPRGSALPIPAPVSATDAVEAERVRLDEAEVALVGLVYARNGISTDDPDVEKFCDDRGGRDDTVNRCCTAGLIKQIGDGDSDNFSLVPWWWPYASATQARDVRDGFARARGTENGEQS